MAWNKPTSNTVDATSSLRPTGRGKMPRLRRGLLAGAIVVLGAGIAAWLLSNGEATSSSLQKKERGLIKEVSPAAAPTNKVSAAAKTSADKDDGKPKLTRKQLRDIANGRRPFVPPAYTSRVGRVRKEAKLFSNPAEQMIAVVLTVPPGAKSISDPEMLFDKDFDKWFTQAMVNKIEISPEDSEYDRSVKQMVIDAKKEMAQRVKGGEMPSQMMKDVWKELQSLAYCKEEMDNAVRDAIRNGELSDEDVEITLEAANKVLQTRGIDPIKMPGMFKSRYRLLQNQQNSINNNQKKADQEEKQ